MADATTATTCRKCKGDIPVGAKKCMHCGTDLRNWFVRHKILSGILGLFLLGIVSTAVNGGSEGSTATNTADKSSSPAAVPVSNPAEQPKAQPAENKEETTKIGAPLKVGDLVFTVNSANATKKLTSPLGDKDGNWIVVTATVKNESKEAVMIDSSFFKLLAKDGSTYETDSDGLMYIDNNKNFFLEKINPNLSKQGMVLFAVPDGAKPQDFMLQVQTGVFGTETGKIALTK